MVARILRFAFRRLYNELAFTYDIVSWLVSCGEWYAWQRCAVRHLNAAPATCVLELAHGTANLQRDLRQAGYNAVGVDLSRAMGQIARYKLGRAGIVPHLIRCDVRQLPFGERQFSVIISSFPTEFIADPTVIAEIYRVLSPGGQLIVVLAGVVVGKRKADVARLQRSADALPWSAEMTQITHLFEAAGFALTRYTEPCTISLAQLMVASKRI